MEASRDRVLPKVWICVEDKCQVCATLNCIVGPGSVRTKRLHRIVREGSDIMQSPPCVLVFDVESAGQTRSNPNISIGAALVGENGQIAQIDGQDCIFEVFLPSLDGQKFDSVTVTNFWMKPGNLEQWNKWRAFDEDPNRPSLTEQLRKFIDFVDRVTQDRTVEIFVDAAVFDVTRLDMLLSQTDDWPGKPVSSSFLLKNKNGERYYSSVLDIRSFYYAWSRLPYSYREFVCKNPGGIKAWLCLNAGVSPAVTKYKRDHYASHDAAQIAEEFAFIRALYESPPAYVDPEVFHGRAVRNHFQVPPAPRNRRSRLPTVSSSF